MVVRKNLKLSLIYKFTKGRLLYTPMYQIGVAIPFDLCIPVFIMGGALGFVLSMEYLLLLILAGYLF